MLKELQNWHGTDKNAALLETSKGHSDEKLNTF